MKKKRMILAALLIIGMQTLMAQQDNVTNIRAVQEDKMVTITYDLKTRSDVRLLISIDDGEHYTDTMKVTGFVNRSILTICGCPSTSALSGPGTTATQSS